MSTKRSGNRVVSELSRSILFIIKRGAVSVEEIIDILSSSFDEINIRDRIYSLTYNKFLYKSANRELVISNKGLATLDNLEFKQIKTTGPWDELWRIVIYDIPESKRLARDRIRQLLKELGFRQLQISVWAHPLPCLNQFRQIQKAYGIEQHLLLLEAKDSSEFRSLKNKFVGVYPQIRSH